MLSRRRMPAVLVGLILFGLGVCPGCGNGGRVPVSGTLLTQAGQPVVKARVTARNGDTGETVTAISDDAGTFALGGVKPGDGVPPGKYQLAVIEDQGDWDHPNPPTIHRKYQNPATSTLELEISGMEAVNLELKLDPP